MKKIAIHSNTLWSLSNFRFDLIKDLKEQGYQVCCIAPQDDISEISEPRLRSLNTEVEFIRIDRKGTNPLKDFGYLLRLIKLFKRIEPDIILYYTPKPNIYGSLACQWLGIPYINTVNGLGSGFLSGFPVATVMQGLYKLALRKSTKVFVQNRDDLDYLLKSKVSPVSISSVIPGSGVDVSRFRHEGERKPDPQSLKFLFAGRLIKEKGIYDFVYMAEQLKSKHPNCKFWVVGFLDEGNPSSLSKTELQYLIDAGTIEYKGKTDHIEKYLNTSDVVVFPSEREGLPRTLIEAASCSMPIITYDVPGCREVVRNGVNGLLCQAGDREDLTHAGEKLVKMPQAEIVQLGENGRKRVLKNFDVKLVNQYYLAALSDVFRTQS